MPSTDLLEHSAMRVELDQRSRDARLRLEKVERLLAVHPISMPSQLRRLLARLGWRICAGRQTAGRSVRRTANRTQLPRSSGIARRVEGGGFSEWRCSTRCRHV
jgi:hypothetical protein